ncbi:MAG: FMN-binding protein [Eubacterium sp.]
MKNIVKDTLILFAITLVAGLGLGFVYNVTSDARAKQEEKTKVEAYESVMPGLDSFEDVKIDRSAADQYITDRIKTTESDNGISPIKAYNATVEGVVQAKDKEGNELGYIVTITDSEAYGGSLQMTVGILSDGTVKGISFLSLNETPGLGMKADEDSFKGQFRDKKVDYFKYNKAGASADNEISAISSATITTNAVTHGVNGAIYCVEFITGGGK